MSEAVSNLGASGPLEDLVQVFLSRLPASLTKRPLEPLTLLHESLADLKTRFDADPAKGPRLLSALTDAAWGTTLRDSAARQAQPFAKDPRFLAFRELVVQSDAKAPLAFMEQIVAYFQPKTLCRDTEVLEKLEAARNLKGEAQSGALKDALEKAGELHYLPFLQIVWTLTCRVRGEPPTQIDTLGKLIKDIGPRLPKDSPLLYQDAGWLRNGAAHGRWMFLPDSQEIEVSDRSHPPIRYRAAELLQQVEEWCILSVKILRAVISAYVADHWAAIATAAHEEIQAARSTRPPQGS